MYRLSYRKMWYVKHPIAFLLEIYHDTRQGIEKIIEWLPIIWYDRDWDHSWLLTILEHKFTKMANLQDHSWHQGCKQTARQLRMCAQLCKRIQKECYMDRRDSDWCPELGPWNRKTDNRFFDKKYYKHYDEYMIQQDLELLTKLICKYLRTWWD